MYRPKNGGKSLLIFILDVLQVYRREKDRKIAKSGFYCILVASFSLYKRVKSLQLSVRGKNVI